MATQKPIYVDYAAATPLLPDALEAMWPFFSEQFYNPSSSYQAAKQVKRAIEDVRTRVAHWIGSKPAEVIFTAGATESINLAINGVMRTYPDARVAVSAIEHEAVLATAKQYSHTIIPVTPDGLVHVADLKQYIDDQTVLISIGYANNEIGTIQPLKNIAQVLQEVRQLRRLKNNPLPLFLHTDASQAACYLDLHASRLGVDLLTLNGGKMYGPKQTGILFVKAGLRLAPQVAGGGQEMGLRSGTENVAGAVGLATALDVVQSQRKEAVVKVGVMRDQLQHSIMEALPHTVVNGNQKKRLPNILNLAWPGVDGERLIMQLDQAGIMASTGSACAANKQTASHVLQALGLDNATIQGSLRLSFGVNTTPEELKKLLNALVRFV